MDLTYPILKFHGNQPPIPPCVSREELLKLQLIANYCAQINTKIEVAVSSSFSIYITVKHMPLQPLCYHPNQLSLTVPPAHKSKYRQAADFIDCTLRKRDKDTYKVQGNKYLSINDVVYLIYNWIQIAVRMMPSGNADALDALANAAAADINTLNINTSNIAIQTR